MNTGMHGTVVAVQLAPVEIGDAYLHQYNICIQPSGSTVCGIYAGGRNMIATGLICVGDRLIKKAPRYVIGSREWEGSRVTEAFKTDA